MKKPTIHDIATELDVTPSTVSRALKNNPRISDATKEAVIKTARKLNYQPNNIASALRNGRSNIVGVVIPTSDRRFFASVVKGIEQVLSEQNYSCIISQSDDLYAKEKKNINDLLGIQVDGIIASIAKETTDHAHYKRAIDQGVPVVLFDRVSNDLCINTVTIDDYECSMRAVTHLIEQGCTKIAHFAGNQDITIYSERFRGYKDALKKHDLPVREEWILEGELIDETSNVVQLGHTLTNTLFDGDAIPDAIFSSSDFAAMGAIQNLKQRGISIPEEMALVGFSNDVSTSFVDPGLTSVDQHTLEMGNIAANLFLEQVNSDNTSAATPRKTLLRGELIVRESSLRHPV